MIILLLLAGCAPSNRSGISETVTKRCRSILSGDIRGYRDTVGGDLLESFVRDPSVRNRFTAHSRKLTAQGVVFDGVFITSVEVHEYRMQAEVQYIEKLRDSRKSWAYTHTAVLEFIDGKWRIILDRQKKTG